VGPKTSLTQDCSKHPGSKIIFRTDPSDDSTKSQDNNRDFCEKCFAEAYKGKQEARNAAQEKVPAQASDSLLARLKEPAQPLQTPDGDEVDEIEVPKSQREQVLDLHKKIESLCQALAAKIHKKHEGLYLNH